jgi:pyruvate,water dikinase
VSTAVGKYVLDFSQIGLSDLARVGGKNASLGELFRALKSTGVGVLDGFASTADAYRQLLRTGGLEDRLRAIFDPFDPENLDELTRRGQAARAAVLETPLPEDLRAAIVAGYERLSSRLGREPELAVRSSATAEDLPEASFAGAKGCCARFTPASRRCSPIARSATALDSDTTSSKWLSPSV